MKIIIEEQDFDFLIKEITDEIYDDMNYALTDDCFDHSDNELAKVLHMQKMEVLKLIDSSIKNVLKRKSEISDRENQSMYYEQCVGKIQ